MVYQKSFKNVRVYPSANLKGSIQVPGDKSISHRAVMLSALSKGKSCLRGLLLGEDVKATISCFRQMGVQIEEKGKEVIVEGVGLHGLKAPAEVLDCGNSGTTMRLMMGILSAQPFVSRLTGDSSLNRRPMERVAEPLRQMGAHIEELRASETERVIKISGRPLKGIEYHSPVASAQVKSALLLAGLYASGATRVIEPMPSRDHSEIMLKHKGASLKREENAVEISSAKSLKSEDIEIPGDISSAAFFLVGACLGEHSQVKILNVGINPTRTGIIDVLEAMGIEVVKHNIQKQGGEEVADLFVQSSPLVSTELGGELIPRLIDEIPVICVAASHAQGKTEIRDAAELKVKESNRIDTVVEELNKMNVQIRALDDGILIQGPNQITGGEFASHGDHRIAMSLMIAATYAPKPSIIRDVQCIQTSYPEFFSQYRQLGGHFEWVD